MKFCFGYNGEQFEGIHDTRDDAFETAKEEADGRPIYTAVVVPFDMEALISGINFLGIIREGADDSHGEHVKDWLQGVPPLLVKDLNKRMYRVLDRWMKDHKQTPSFCGVKDIVRHVGDNEQIMIVKERTFGKTSWVRIIQVKSVYSVTVKSVDCIASKSTYKTLTEAEARFEERCHDCA